MHRSHRRTFAEHVAVLMRGRMCRCHECNARFLQIGGSLIRTKDLQEVFQKSLIALTMAGAVLMVLLVILWFSHVQAGGSGESSGADTTHSMGTLYDA